MRLKMLLYLGLLLHLAGAAVAQKSGVLLLKKGHRTVRNFFKEGNMEFFTPDGLSVQGQVEKITRDSLFLIHHHWVMRPTGYGTFVRDTLGQYPLAFSMQNIGAFPRPPGKARLITEGTLFMLAGGSYALLNVINTLADGDPVFGKDNRTSLLSGLGVAAVGVALRKLRKDRVQVGGRYRLQLIEP